MAKAPKKPGTEIVDWEAQMAAQAEIAAGAQRSSSGGGKFFSMRGGILSFDNSPMPGNQMPVIIIADTLMNSYYEGAFDPDTPASPVCFAFAKKEGDLAPDPSQLADPYFTQQNDECAGCPQNEWGSAATGRGKACKNGQRLAMIPAGSYKQKGTGRNATFDLDGPIEDPAHYADAEVAYMNLPVMSVKQYGAFVKQVAAEFRRPPHAVFANVWVEPDPKSQFVVKFEVLEVVPNDILGVIMPRHEKEQIGVDFPYQPPMKADEATPAKANNKLKGKTAAKK